MKRNTPDELGWKLGEPNRELFAASQIAWASLGDLVHDSVDPSPEDKKSVDEFYNIDKFQIHTRTVTKRDGLIRRVIGTHSTNVWMASWKHQSHDADNRPHYERRFALELHESIKNESGLMNSRVELLLGLGGLICTRAVNFEREDISWSQTRAISPGQTELFAKFLHEAPTTDLFNSVKSRKRQGRTEFESQARSMQEVVGEIVGYSSLGSAVLEDGMLNSTTESIRKSADRVNGIRLPILYCGVRLFDCHRQQISDVDKT